MNNIQVHYKLDGESKVESFSNHECDLYTAWLNATYYATALKHVGVNSQKVVSDVELRWFPI